MATTTVRIESEDHATLTKIAKLENRKPREVIHDLVERRLRELLIKQTGDRYRRLSESEAHREEMADWQSTTGDAPGEDL